MKFLAHNADVVYAWFVAVDVPVFVCCCVGAERDTLLLHRELVNDHAVPHGGGSYDHAQDGQDRHQQLQ